MSDYSDDDFDQTEYSNNWHDLAGFNKLSGSPDDRQQKFGHAPAWTQNIFMKQRLYDHTPTTESDNDTDEPQARRPAFARRKSLAPQADHRRSIPGPRPETSGGAATSSELSSESEQEPEGRKKSVTFKGSDGPLIGTQSTTPTGHYWSPDGADSTASTKENQDVPKGYVNPGFTKDPDDPTETTKLQEDISLEGYEPLYRHTPLSWDKFRSFKYNTDLNACEKLFSVFEKIFKVIFIVIALLLILATQVASKLSMLFATANMNINIGFKRTYGECRETLFEETAIEGSSCTYSNVLKDNRHYTDNQCGVPVRYDLDIDDEDVKARDTIRWGWCLLMSMCVPYVFTIIHNLWKICFKHKKAPTARAVFFVMFFETLHIVGLMMLVFVVLPEMDIFRAIFIMNATALYPAFFKLFIRNSEEKSWKWKIFADVTAFLLQLSALGLYIGLTFWESENRANFKSCYECSAENTDTVDVPDCTSYSNNTNGNTTDSVFEFTRCGPGVESVKNPQVWLIPVSLLLISFGWWQNFLGKHLQMRCANGLDKLNKEIKKGKSKLFIIVTIWKMIFAFVSYLVLFHLYIQNDMEFEELFGVHKNNRSAFHYEQNIHEKIETDWLIVFGVNAASGLICYLTSVYSIQAKTQRVTFSLALTLATPVTFIVGLYVFCWNCERESTIDLWWNCFDGFNNFLSLIESRPMVLVGIAFWLSQLILGRYLWHPKCERLAKTGRIFIQPYYNGLLLEQSLTYNRTRDDTHKKKSGELPDYDDNKKPEVMVKRNAKSRASMMVHAGDEDTPDEISRAMAQMDEPLYDRMDRSQPMVFVCATMWHETEKEMIQVMKSILRLDVDQTVKRLTRDYFRVPVPDYYDFEAHIMFDDGFDTYIPGDPMFKVNRFVERFVGVMKVVCGYVYQENIYISPPVKLPTPYGGQLVYTLPGGNKLVVHIKDKQKIRHRKRWSQVMYMYFLLAHRLYDQPLRRKVKEQVAYNTYILTLDGDVDFQPKSVMMLIDSLKRNFSVGAVCGRIHPVGHGPMVWYQKFEYAISHWLQKSTEHVLGCVLCSPGCFSMFRASALMDDNVMHIYTTKAEQAAEYVQYDQGEDRWLCTLLLQRGYRVEYCAAADAKTFAPEGFNEFFNQRRRWTPSTFANIMDLLRSAWLTSSKNEHISFLYMIYQGGLFISGILGPATVFLMTAGAFATVFQGMSVTGTFFLVFTPVMVFFLLCMFAPSNIQLLFASLLGGLFGVAQMVVLVGIIVGIAEDGLCSPNSWFLLGTVGIFLLSALIHPREFFNIIHGILYFIAVPTMYMLLIVYSLCNLNEVSWGTREVQQTQYEKDKLKARQLELAHSKSSDIKSQLKSFFASGTHVQDEESWTISCGKCCRCQCCPEPGRDEPLIFKQLPEPDYSDDESDREEKQKEPPVDYIEYSDDSPYWIRQNDSLDNGPTAKLQKSETTFWKELIHRYLEPINKDPAREERIKKDLKNLRNKAVIGFFMIDIVFIALMQTLQVIPAGTNPSTNETIHYYWEFKCTDPIKKTTDLYEIEPIGFAFLTVFGLFLVIQLFGMFYHRLLAFAQIISTTILIGKRKGEEARAYKRLTSMFISPPAQVPTPSESEGSEPSANDNLLPTRPPIATPKPTKVYKTVDEAFVQNFLALQQEVDRISQNLDDAETTQANFNFIRRRLSSLFQKRDFAHMINGVKKRKSSVHDEVLAEIAKRKDKVFGENRVERIKNHFQATEDDISIAHGRLNHILNFDGAREDFYY